MVTSTKAMAAGFNGLQLPASLRERLFFGGMAVLLALVIFAGFAPSYYLHRSFGSPVALTPILHIHGLVFTAWMLLLITQTSLIAARRVKWHQRLGMASIGLVVLMVTLGSYVAVAQGRALMQQPDAGTGPLEFMVIPLGAIVVFPMLFAAAVYYRRRSDIHKRLMIIGTLELVAAGVARLPVIATMGPAAFLMATDLLLLPMIAYDWLTQKRIHPATLVAGSLLVVSHALRLLLGETTVWQQFAAWLVGMPGAAG